MNWLKKMQDRYKAGKMTPEEYKAKLEQGLEDEVITQQEHDDALDYDPADDKGSDPELIYSQEDVDRMAHTVARRELRKAFKNAGLPLDVPNKGIIDHVISLVKGNANDEGNGGAADPKELARLQKIETQYKALQPKLTNLTLENAVLKGSDKYSPVNATQVVRALGDYTEDLEFDENGLPEKDSLDLVMRKLVKSEPNLFKTRETDPPGDQGEPEANGKIPPNPGKPPGGSAGGTPPPAAKHQALVQTALERMGHKKP